MNTIFGNFLERTIPNLRNAIINLTIGGNNAEMNLEDFKAVMAPEPTPIPEPNYKVYTALLTQSGSDDLIILNSGTLTIGQTYWINEAEGVDFTNVGAPNNETNTYFVATGTTPNSWGEGEGIGEVLITNEGAPVVTVLENTIGNIWFKYISVGYYAVNSNDLFTVDKTTINLSPKKYIESPDDIYAADAYWNNSSQSALDILSYYNNEPQDSALNNNGNVMLEIRVYN
jgi:hypothetical protein